MKKKQKEYFVVCLVSGLRVNLAKRSILPIGHMDNIQLLAGVLGCNVDAFPAT